MSLDLSHSTADRGKRENTGYGAGFYFVLFVSLKGGKACKSLRLKKKMFQRTRDYPVTNCKLTMETENTKPFVFVSSILLSLLLVKSIDNFKYHFDKIGLYVSQITMNKK